MLTGFRCVCPLAICVYALRSIPFGAHGMFYRIIAKQFHNNNSCCCFPLRPCIFVIRTLIIVQWGWKEKWGLSNYLVWSKTIYRRVGFRLEYNHANLWETASRPIKCQTPTSLPAMLLLPSLVRPFSSFHEKPWEAGCEYRFFRLEGRDPGRVLFSRRENTLFCSSTSMGKLSQKYRHHHAIHKQPLVKEVDVRWNTVLPDVCIALARLTSKRDVHRQILCRYLSHRNPPQDDVFRTALANTPQYVDRRWHNIDPSSFSSCLLWAHDSWFGILGTYIFSILVHDFEHTSLSGTSRPALFACDRSLASRTFAIRNPGDMSWVLHHI